MEKIGGMPEKLDAIMKKKPKEDPVGLFLERFGEALDIEHAVAGEIDFSYLAPEQRAESMWAVYNNITLAMHRLKHDKREGGKTKRYEERITKDRLKELRLGLGVIKRLYEDAEVRKVYLDSYQRHIQENESINGDLEKYKALSRTIRENQKIAEACARKIFSKRGGKSSELDILLFENGKRQLAEKRHELAGLVRSNPELGGLDQYQKIKKGSEELRTERFIWTPSRRKLLEETEEAALSGKPVLFSGESGTGKTRLVEQASLRLTGQINNLTPGKDTRFQDLIAKPKISPEGGTYYEYKEIGEAFTGRSSTLEEDPQHNGRIVADDEFNLRPEADQSGIMAAVSAWTPGKKVRMPVTNQELEIMPNSMFCAMVNLASERYTRKKIPPEVLRKFAKVDVGYLEQSAENPEIYETMLSALLDENGRLRAAKEEVAPLYEFREESRIAAKDGQNVRQTVNIRELKMLEEKDGKTIVAGGFLWRLANALDQINKSFSQKETVLKAKGDAQDLKDLIIDIGTIIGWLKEYGTLGRGKSLEIFFVDKIQKEFLSREAYSLEDRKLVEEFLKYFDIDLEKKSEKPDRKFEIMTPLEIGLLSPRVKYERIVSEEPVLKESFFVSPDGKRIEYKIERFEQDGREFSPGEVYVVTKPDGKKYACKFLGINKENGLPVVVPYKKEQGKTRREKNAASAIKTKWKNPETGKEQAIEINLEDKISEFKSFYKDNLNLEINESEIRDIWNKNYAEIKGEIEKYGYDSVIIVPENLPSEADVNKKAIETMNEGAGKVAATKYWVEQQSISSAVENKYKIILTHSDQNIYENTNANPYLKATLGKNIPMLILNISPKEWDSMKDKEKEKRTLEAFQKLKQGAGIDFEAEINGKKIKIQAEGLSLEEYEIFQRIYFKKNQGKHLDEKGWTWLAKSFSGSRVVNSHWNPVDRQLDVHADDPGGACVYLGLRLSRSFSN